MWNYSLTKTAVPRLRNARQDGKKEEQRGNKERWRIVKRSGLPFRLTELVATASINANGEQNREPGLGLKLERDRMRNRLSDKGFDQKPYRIEIKNSIGTNIKSGKEIGSITKTFHIKHEGTHPMTTLAKMQGKDS
ncbi:hypothetical protein EVAR_70239_1 [Eumeta japonica]|uniref:Uncharacterized protein n=1 Tax=Eumeta variegata TaxID=151549 RepID=A0A4C2A4S1_EUMVA|nr:hypothetical protein EVAR_70239_1 [Eumeta japonica]